MLEVRIHGRGGQGVRMSAHILGRAAFLSGYKTQDFALYQAERRGAPVASFVRFGKEDVLERGYIQDPDAVIVLDETLNFEILLRGIKPGGFVIINSHRSKEWFKKKFNIRHKVYCIAATDIALKILGKPIANCAILGSLIKLIGLPEKNLEKAIKIELGKRHPEAVEKNIKAARVCYGVIK